MEEFEREILHKIKNRNGKVLMLPVDIWVNLIDFSESVEDYETCQILFNLIDIVTLQTFRDFVEADDRKWHKNQLKNNF